MKMNFADKLAFIKRVMNADAQITLKTLDDKMITFLVEEESMIAEGTATDAADGVYEFEDKTITVEGNKVVKIEHKSVEEPEVENEGEEPIVEEPIVEEAVEEATIEIEQVIEQLVEQVAEIATEVSNLKNKYTSVETKVSNLGKFSTPITTNKKEVMTNNVGFNYKSRR